MRDDERDESDRARAGGADAVAANSLENQRYDNGAPSDKNGGRIKVGDRRTFLEIHPRNHSEGGNRECEQQEIEGRAIKRPVPSEPRAAGQEERQNVKHHAVGERIDLAEEKLERRAFRSVSLVLCQRAGEKIDMLIEKRSIVRAIGVADLRIRSCDRLDFPFAN